MFKNSVKEISQDFPSLGESGSEVSHFIPEIFCCYRSFKKMGQYKETVAKGNSQGYQKPN